MKNELTPQEIAKSLENQDLYPVTRLDEDREALRQGAALIRKIANGEYAPVVHGRWGNEPETGDFICSNCGVSTGLFGDGIYCQRCGALMDGKDGESHENN